MGLLFDLTKDEEKTLKALEKSYEKLLKEVGDLILKLRPDDPEPDLEKYKEIEASRLPEPKELKPKPIKIMAMGVPTYDAKELKAYHDTPEYKAFVESQKQANKAIEKLWDDWYNAGSQEWKDAREKQRRIERELIQAREDFRKSVENRYFEDLGSDPGDILEDAQKLVRDLIERHYKYFEAESKRGGLSSKLIRSQEGGGFLLDTTEERELLKADLSRHFEELRDDQKRLDILNMYIEDVLRNSEYVGSSGEIFGLVKPKPGLKAEPLKKKTVLITRLMDIAFNGDYALERNYEKDFNDLTNMHTVGVYEELPYKLRVAIDYRSIEENEIVKFPPLTGLARHIYNAIISYWLAGNYEPSYRQVWRAAMGNMNRSIKFDDEERKALEMCLLSFKSSLAYNTGQIVQLREKEGKPPIVLEKGGTRQLLYYGTDYVKFNGQPTDVILLDPYKKPILLEIAEVLNNQYMTDNIAFFDVPGLANTVDNLDLKDYLFIRIKKMKNPNNNVVQHKISLDTLVEDLKIEPFDKKNANDRKRKSRLVERIIKILKNAEEKARFIGGYEVNKRKGSTEVISFTIHL